MKNNLNIIMVLSVSIFLLSCASVDVSEKTEEEQIVNRLVFFQTGITLPEGWSFYQPKPEDEASILFCFKNRENTILGFFKYIKNDLNLSCKNFTEYYSKNILKNYNVNEIIELSLKGNETCIISGIHKVNKMEIMLAFIIESNNINIIEFFSKEGILFKNTDIVYKIIESYCFEEGCSNIRLLCSSLRFYCFNGAWQWLEDYKNGFYLKGKIEGANCVVGIWETDIKDTEKLFANTGNFDISLFEAYFFINNQKVSTKGTGYKDENGFTKLYYICEYRSNKYCIFISIPGQLSLKPENMHTQKSIIDLFRFNLLFGPF